MNKTQSILSLENVSKSYITANQNLQILNKVNLHISSNTAVGLIGPSGCGKSTLLTITGLLDSADTGQVTINKTTIQQGTEFRKQSDATLSTLRLESIGFIFQFHHLLSDFTALENVMAPMRLLRKLTSKQQYQRALHLLEAVGMSHRMHHYPKNLSGGEKQRVAIARALANQPKIILADEPTGNLDENNATDVFNLLMQTIKKENTSLLMVSHNQKLLSQLDQTYQLSNGKLEPWL
ncbi:MAG: lipoprotein-releasing system ATP-binding protein LolD [Rickettsiales bacterium]|nr:lipoprotein-releasing system ATP-binding protein LolD [Rickettsiales bacterium]|tara:strand:+ start:29362 stop:30072 length:711 start_codon:yes stop_codon:yes gene_type:complete